MYQPAPQQQQPQFITVMPGQQQQVYILPAPSPSASYMVQQPYYQSGQVPLAPPAPYQYPMPPPPQDSCGMNKPCVQNGPDGVPVMGIPIGPTPTPVYGGTYPMMNQNLTRIHSPTVIDCPNCHYHGMDRVRYEAGSETYLIMVVLCCCFWPLTCVPLCVSNCQDGVHICPQCNTLLGVSKPCSS